MPSSVKQAVAHYDFTRNNLANIMQVADDVYQSTRPTPSVAAIAALPSAPNPNSDLSHKEVLNQAFALPNGDDPSAQIASLAAQVAAMQKKFSKGNGRGGSNQGRGGNRGGGNQTPRYSASNPRHKSPRHPDLPPFGACKRHWQFGKSSFVCLEPTTCPWKNFIAPKPQN